MNQLPPATVNEDCVHGGLRSTKVPEELQHPSEAVMLLYWPPQTKSSLEVTTEGQPTEEPPTEFLCESFLTRDPQVENKVQIVSVMCPGVRVGLIVNYLLDDCKVDSTSTVNGKT